VIRNRTYKIGGLRVYVNIYGTTDLSRRVARWIGWRRWEIKFNPFAPAEGEMETVERGCIKYSRPATTGAGYPPIIVGSAWTRFGARKGAKAYGLRIYYGAKGPYRTIWVERQDR
jgi:hypothetical protein